MYPTTDDFADKQGRWSFYAPWDGTEFSEVDSGFLETQNHVDIRSFRVFNDFVSVPQFPDLDTVVQDPNLVAVPQTSLEIKPEPVITETWAIVAGETGIDASSLTIGKIADRGGWSGLQFETDNAAGLAVTLESKTPNENIDISEQNNISIIFPDYNSFDGTSYVQFTSHPLGTFGAGYDSAQVPFSDNTSVMPQLMLPIADFANAGFMNTHVTGVRIRLIKAAAPADATLVTMMAIRALHDDWVESWLDFDTRWGLLYRPVTLDAEVTTGSVAQDFEFIRGDGTRNDPFPADGQYSMFFHAGGETSPVDAGDNTISFLLREVKDEGAGTGSVIHARLIWNATDTTFEAQRVDTTGGSPGSQIATDLYTEDMGMTLEYDKLYAFTVKLVGTSLYARLNEVTRNREIDAQVWELETINSEDYEYRNGRVGFVGSLIRRDAYIDAFVEGSTSFGLLRTRFYNTRTPVDGAKLSAVFSPDDNLFSSVTGGTDLFRDQTKTVSGTGSYRTGTGLVTNQFVVEDWLHTYLNISIWVPAGSTRANQPVVTLNSPSENVIRMPKLQPAQWNNLEFDLSIFRQFLTGLPYSIGVRASLLPDQPLGFFWVDSIVIGRRKVAWSARAQENAPFRTFAGLANDPNGSVHFNPNERGKALQLQAEALTPDAWVAEFQMFPHYAELGLPLYDQAFETR